MPAMVLKNERSPIHAGMLIGGEWTGGAQCIEVFNPARPDVIRRGRQSDFSGAIGDYDRRGKESCRGFEHA
jgi:hypothetical protein